MPHVMMPSVELVGNKLVEVFDRLQVFKKVAKAIPGADVFDQIRAAEWVMYGPEEERETSGKGD
jgi:hypothetical protein